MAVQRSTLAVAILVLTALSPARDSQADILTFVMEGVVTGVGSDPPGLPNYAQIGERVKYTFTFDTAAPNLYPPSTGGYYQAISSSLLVGGRPFACGAPAMLIVADTFGLDFSIDAPDSTITGGSGAFRLTNQGYGQVIWDYSPPLAPYNLSLFRSLATGFGVNLFAPPLPGWPYRTLHYFGGEIDSFYAIPEPVSLGFIVLGIPLLARSHRSSR